MKTNSIALLIVVLLFPVPSYAQDMFFWSAQTFEEGAQSDEVIMHFANQSDSLEPFTVYLYYRPGKIDINSFSMDLKFPHCEVVDAEVFDFDISIGGSPIGMRWDHISEFTVDGDSVLNLGASSSVNIGGLRIANTGAGQFYDEGYDVTAGAFLVASVTLKCVYTKAEYLDSTFFLDGSQVFPQELQETEIDTELCVLDPPYGGFMQAFELPSDSGISGGTYHCLTKPFSSCDGTVWNRYVPSADGLITCNTFGSSSQDTILEIYSGATNNQLEQIAFNDDVDGSGWSRVYVSGSGRSNLQYSNCARRVWAVAPRLRIS